MKKPLRYWRERLNEEVLNFDFLNSIDEKFF